MAPSKDIEEARALVIKLTELMVKPAVRNDPVIKALIQGMGPKNSEFATASLAVSTLRNAGCLEQTAETTTSTKSTGLAGKEKVEKQKKSKDTSTAAPSKKLRGFHRAIDLLIEEDMARGTYEDGTPVPKDKEDHWLAKEIRRLREDPDREVELKMLAAEYEDGTYPNGKKFHKFVKLKIVTDKDGKPNHLADAEESGLRKVKDISDWDLLATESPSSFGQPGDLSGRYTAWNLDHLFVWADPKASGAGDYQNLDRSDPLKTYPSLKGTPLLEKIKSSKADKDIRGELLKMLSEQAWSQFGPSTTLWWKLKGRPKAGASAATTSTVPLPQRK